MNMKMDMKMQTRSLTVCGANGKAVIPQLLRYTKCDTHLSQRIKVKKVLLIFTFSNSYSDFFYETTPNTRVQSAVIQQNTLFLQRFVHYRLFQSSVRKFHQIIVLHNNKCSVHLNESVNIIGWLVFFAFLLKKKKRLEYLFVKNLTFILPFVQMKI